MRIGEADCKDHFNKIKPADVVKHAHDATAWLRQEPHWRATQYYWSIHKYDKCLDRRGKATAFNFDLISHEELTSILEFSLTDDRFCTAVGGGNLFF